MAAKIFKPRRGKKSTMTGTKANTVLATGELFVEVPDTGAGTGTSKIKIGDGVTTYTNLPYALGDMENYSEIPISTISGTSASTILSTNVVDGKPLKTLLSGLKSAILSHDSTITTMETNISNFSSALSTIVSSALGSALGLSSSSTAATVTNAIQGVTVRSGSSTTLSAGGSTTVSAGYYPSSYTISANSLSSQTSGTATAARILSGYTAWVNGTKLTGTYSPPSTSAPTMYIYHRYVWYDGVAVDVSSYSSMSCTISGLNGAAMQWRYLSSLAQDAFTSNTAYGTLFKSYSSNSTTSLSVSSYNYVSMRIYYNNTSDPLMSTFYRTGKISITLYG